jgi:hypothetical protein
MFDLMRNLPALLFVLLTVVGCQTENEIRAPEHVFLGPGNAPPAGAEIQIDRYTQKKTGYMDVLWVVDNSCSMIDDQQELAANFPAFFQFFATSTHDYRLGVVSTDMSDPTQSGRLRGVGGHKWIDRHTPDPVTKFRVMTSMGTGGSTMERGRDAAYAALETLRDTDNAGFYQNNDGRALHLIFVSDEPDYSSDISISEFIEWLGAQKNSPSMVTASSIVGLGLPTATPCAARGTGYLETTRAIGGVERSICTKDWSEILEQLGLLTGGPKREFFLSSNPIPETIQVRVIEEPVTLVFEGPWDDNGDTGYQSDWIYNQSRNSISFLEYTPNPLAKVEIEYVRADNGWLPEE